jgi:hypothetical protein
MTRTRFFISTGLAIFLGLTLSGTVVLAGGEASVRQRSRLAAAPETAASSEIQATLWDQTDTTGGDSVNSSNYTAVSDHQIADDFVISDTVNNYWQVTGVKVVGRYSPPGATQATSVNLQFYADVFTNTKHIPGTLIYNAVVNTALVSGTVTINLSSPVLLAVGNPITYWVSVQANMVNTSDAWLWTERNSVSPFNGTSPSVYMGTGGNGSCNTGSWKRRILDCAFPSGSTNPDMRFAILGQAVIFTDFVYLPSVRR